MFAANFEIAIYLSKQNNAKINQHVFEGSMKKRPPDLPVQFEMRSAENSHMGVCQIRRPKYFSLQNNNAIRVLMPRL